MFKDIKAYIKSLSSLKDVFLAIPRDELITLKWEEPSDSEDGGIDDCSIELNAGEVSILRVLINKEIDTMGEEENDSAK